jgi:hypothetical protein
VRLQACVRGYLFRKRVMVATPPRSAIAFGSTLLQGGRDGFGLKYFTKLFLNSYNEIWFECSTSQDTPLIADYSGTVHDLITTKVCDQSTIAGR